MTRLIFEHVGDVNFKYPYLCVYLDRLGDPFMEISVTDEQEIQFVLYPGSELIPLTKEDFQLILKTGESFLPEAIKIYESE